MHHLLVTASRRTKQPLQEWVKSTSGRNRSITTSSGIRQQYCQYSYFHNFTKKSVASNDSTVLTNLLMCATTTAVTATGLIYYLSPHHEHSITAEEFDKKIYTTGSRILATSTIDTSSSSSSSSPHHEMYPDNYDSNDYYHENGYEYFNADEYFGFDEQEEKRSFEQTLHHHKSLFQEYKAKWDWQQNNSAASRIPTVSWPLDVPDEDEIPTLFMDLTFCQRHHQKQSKGSDHNDNDDDDDSNNHYCQKLQFKIASHLLLQTHDIQAQIKALDLIKNLVEKHRNPDAICAYAICLNDGRILQTSRLPKDNSIDDTNETSSQQQQQQQEIQYQEPNPKMAVSWWKIASDQYHHTQSTYELAVALYTGEGIAEDESMAVHYFRKAAECGHAGAQYMLGDCLLDGVGTRRDRAEALEWLIMAAELGHRGSRSRVLAVLEKEDGRDYGEFTDASRQTLRENKDGEGNSDTTIDDEQVSEGEGPRHDPILERHYTNKKPVSLERRHTIGGGAGNPVVLARRKTIVGESRVEG